MTRLEKLLLVWLAGLTLCFGLAAAGQFFTVPQGGTGRGSFVAQTPVLGGTTTTGALQSAANPGANIVWGWDNTDVLFKPFTIGTGLTYTHGTHTLSSTGSITLGEAVGSADPYRYLRTDGSSNLAENAAFTSGRVPYATTNGLLTDSANLTYDGTKARIVTAMGLGAGYGLLVTDSGTNAGNGAIQGHQTGASGQVAGLAGDSLSTTAGAAGTIGQSNAATGATYGLYGTTLSNDNAAYSVYATEHSYLGNYFDLPSASTPAAAPASTLRIWGDSGGALHTINAASTSRQIAYVTDIPTVYGQNTILAPVGLADSSAGTVTLTSTDTFCVYVGKAPAAFSSCTIYYDLTSGPIGSTGAAIGLCKGVAPDAGAASLTYLGSATLSGGQLGTGAKSRAVTLTVNAAAGDDIWACITNTGGVAVSHACLPDLLAVGCGQHAASDFTASGGWSAQATTSDGTSASVYMKVRIAWP